MSNTAKLMKQMTKPTWHYSDPGSLAASGIYTSQDFENLRDHIMFPAEKKMGLLNTVARGVRGEPTLTQGISLFHLNSQKHSTKNHGKRLEENLGNVFILWQCNFRNNWHIFLRYKKNKISNGYHATWLCTAHHIRMVNTSDWSTLGCDKLTTPSGTRNT